LTRQIPGYLSGVTSLCTVTSSKASRDVDLMEYSVSCLGLDGASAEDYRLKRILDKLMSNYGRVVPIRALHDFSKTLVRIREVVLENDVSWFFATKEAVLSALDRMRLMTATLEAGSSPLLTYDDVAGIRRNKLGVISKLQTGVHEFSYSTDFRKRLLIFNPHSTTISMAYTQVDGLDVYYNYSREFGSLCYADSLDFKPVLYTNDFEAITKIFPCGLVAYDAIWVGDTWDIIVIVLCLKTAVSTGFSSVWTERRTAYLQYVSDAVSVMNFGGSLRVQRRDSSIAELSRKYEGFLPLSTLAATVVKPIVLRECLLVKDKATYLPYAEINSYISDLRFLA